MLRSKASLKRHAVSDGREQADHRRGACLFEHLLDGDCALGVGEDRLFRGQARKRSFEAPQGQQRHGRPYLRAPPLGIAALEPYRKTFVEPERHAGARDAVNQRVRELMRQDALELRRILERSLHRHADAAIVGASCPLGGLRDVVELLARVQDDGDDVRGYV